MLLYLFDSPFRPFSYPIDWGLFSAFKSAKAKDSPCTSLYFPFQFFVLLLSFGCRCCYFIFRFLLSLSIKAQQNPCVSSNKFNKFYSSLYYTWMSLIYINAAKTWSYRWVKWFIVVMFICLFSSCLCIQSVYLSLLPRICMQMLVFFSSIYARLTWKHAHDDKKYTQAHNTYKIANTWQIHYEIRLGGS